MEDVKTKSLEVIESLKTFVIKTQEDINFINQRVVSAKELKKWWWDKYDPIVKAAKKAHTLAVKNRDEVCKPLDTFVKRWNGEIGIFNYKQEQERVKKEEEINRQLREKAAQEAAKAAEQAEKDNVAPTPPPPPMQIVMPSTTQKPEGFRSRETHHAEVIDFVALSDDFKIVDQAKLDGLARAYKGSGKLPGVRFYKKINGARVVDTVKVENDDDIQIEV